MKKIFTFLSLFLGLGVMTNAQALYLPETTDTFTGDVVSLENGIAAGDFVASSGARNIVDLETGLQIGVNAADFIPMSFMTLPGDSFYMIAENTLGNIVLATLESPDGQWIDRGFPSAFASISQIAHAFNLTNAGGNPGFIVSNSLPTGNEAKSYILDMDNGTFQEKDIIPLGFNDYLSHAVNVNKYQTSYFTFNSSYFIGDLIFDDNGNIVENRQVNTLTNFNFRIVGITFVKKVPNSSAVILGITIKDETTQLFHNKIFSYNTDTSLPDSQKLTELAEVYELGGIEITSTDNGFYLLQSLTDYQWIKFPGQNQQNFDNGEYFIPQSFHQMTKQEVESLDRVIGHPNDSYFLNDKLFYACNHNQLYFIYENLSFDLFGGMMVLDLNPPFIPVFVSEFTSSIPATVYVGDVFDPNIAVASLATDSSFLVDVNQATGEVVEVLGGYQATKAGTVTFTAYALDAGVYSQNWVLTILDTATVDTTTTGIALLPDEDFKILGNGSGNVTIQTSDFDQYSIVVYNMLGQNLFVQDFTNEIEINLSTYDKGMHPVVIMKDGALFRTMLKN